MFCQLSFFDKLFDFITPDRQQLIRKKRSCLLFTFALHLGDKFGGGAVEVLAAEFEEFYLRHMDLASNLRRGYVALPCQVQHLLLHLLGQPLLGVCPELLVEPLAELLLRKSRQAEQLLHIATRFDIVILNE